MEAIKQLIGVQIAYCDEQGDEHLVWLNLKQVQALAWTAGEIKAKRKGAGGNEKLPTDATGPGTCADMQATGPIGPLCWWNGTQWVCGDEL